MWQVPLATRGSGSIGWRPECLRHKSVEARVPRTRAPAATNVGEVGRCVHEW